MKRLQTMSGWGMGNSGTLNTMVMLILTSGQYFMAYADIQPFIQQQPITMTSDSQSEWLFQYFDLSSFGIDRSQWYDHAQMWYLEFLLKFVSFSVCLLIGSEGRFLVRVHESTVHHRHNNLSTTSNLSQIAVDGVQALWGYLCAAESIRIWNLKCLRPDFEPTTKVRKIAVFADDVNCNKEAVCCLWIEFIVDFVWYDQCWACAVFGRVWIAENA